jgi:DMSO/TMAO reductase YedYZ molybdopterin-dependent catalytic subunit
MEVAGMNGRQIGRRAFLGSAAGAAGLLLGQESMLARADAPEMLDGLIVREREPANLEMPFANLSDFLTPTERFYIRSHFAVPKLDSRSWQLQVSGAVKKPLTLSYADLLALPTRTAAVTLECAGNGRAFLEPKSKGVQWALGAVGTAEWTGVPLADVLERAGIQPSAVDVLLVGADHGEPKNEPKPAGALAFGRSIPLTKALRPEVLLASAMNGKPLTAHHGYPVRAIVGGWYGMASVKWLTRIVVTDRPFHGYDQTIDYAVWDRRDGVPSLAPITEIEIKSSIARPTMGEVLPAGKDYRVFGAAWSGGANVSKVELSTDGGASWTATHLMGKEVPFSWRLWEHTWTKPAAGKHKLMVRATDSRGQSQPLRRDPDRRNYVINHVVTTEVEVRA